MNNLITYSHHINTLMQTVASLSKTVADLDKRNKLVEKQYSDLQVMINRLQERVFDIDAKRPVGNAPAVSSAPFPEDRVKLLIKEHVDVAIKAILAHNETTIQEDQASTPEPSLQEVQEVSLLPGLDNGASLFASLEDNNEITPDDFVIQEKKPAAKKGGRKPKKN